MENTFYKFCKHDHVLGFTIILCEGTKMIKQILITGPYDKNIVCKTKPYQR